MKCDALFLFMAKKREVPIWKGTLFLNINLKRNRKRPRECLKSVYVRYNDKQLAQNNVHTFTCGFLGLYCFENVVQFFFFALSSKRRTAHKNLPSFARDAFIVDLF